MIKKWIPFLLLLVSLPLFAALNGGDDQELLPPDQAFAFSTKVIDGNTIEARWDIAKGYYTYRDKFKFKVSKGNATIGDVSFPKGKMKKDPTFGDTEIYIKQVVLKIPLLRKTAGEESISIRFDYQGCNDPIGVCYPPINKEVTFNLPAGEVGGGSIGSLKTLNSLLKPADGQQQFLPVNKAFPVSADRKNDEVINIIFGVTNGYYLYRDKIRLSLTAADGSTASGIKLGDFKLPKGKMKKDPTFGDTEIFEKTFSLDVPLKVSNQSLTRSTLRVDFQGCAEDGICYPPNKQTYSLELNNGQLKSMTLTGSGFAGSSITSPAKGKSAKPASEIADDGDLTEEEELARLFTNNNLAVILISLLGFGLILAFTACMYPMIPILSSIITGQGEKVTPLKGFILSAVYVGAMGIQ